MIHYLTRGQLNVEKYNHCISKSVNSRIYAYSWYLDIVCDSWDVLVKDDYQIVMPLPKRKKYGIHYIYQVSWVQQLGVFSKISIDESMIEEFIKAIPKKFKLIDIYFNSSNRFSGKYVSIRNNYILLLDEPYETIRKQYSKGRKSSAKQAQNLELVVSDNLDHNEIIQLFKQNKGIELDKKDLNYKVLSKLIESGIRQNFVQSLGVINNKKELIGGAFFLKDKHRITYLFSAINNEGRKKQAMSFLIDTIIKKNAASNYIFDFEGSMIKELASFFKSFGAVKEEYFWYKTRLFR